MLRSNKNDQCRRLSLVTAKLALLLVTAQVVQSFYLPMMQRQHQQRLQLADSRLSRRQDDADDQDDMDQTASAPGYQNQADDSGQGRDGYDEGANDGDGAYDESSRDQEGQADLERFFDDHLGASDKDGMDKENLPSNLKATVVEYPSAGLAGSESSPPGVLAKPSDGDSSTSSIRQQQQRLRSYLSRPVYSYLDKQVGRESGAGARGAAPSEGPSRIETELTRLPDDKLLIMQRAITTSLLAPDQKDGLPPTLVEDTTQLSMIDEFKAKPEDLVPGARRQKKPMEAHESGIVAMENDNMDKVYVTHSTDKPFRIATLGGYDPEEDFENATRDIEGTDDAKSNNNNNKRTTNGQRARRSGLAAAESGSNDESVPLKDIIFNDSDADDLFNDASEDDVIFTHDDPYQTDVDAELADGETSKQRRKNSRDEPDTESSNNVLDDDSSDEPSGEEEESGGELAAKPRMDDDDGSWVNDGVDEMEVPSETEQEEAIEKTTRREAKLRREKERQRRAEEAAALRPNEDGENQRMPNANYLNDLSDIDDD